MSWKICVCFIMEEFYLQVYNNIPPMLKPQGMHRMPRDSTLPQDNRTLVIRLKHKIEQLNTVISQQQITIDTLKRDAKITKLNEMQIEIQHLNEQNKRLLLLSRQLKQKNKKGTPSKPTQKKTTMSCTKITERKTVPHDFKIEPKMFEVLKENEALRKQLVNLKVHESFFKKRTSTLNDRSSIFLEKSLIEHEKLLQGKVDLEAEIIVLADKLKILQGKMQQLARRNEQLQKMHSKALPGCISIFCE